MSELVSVETFNLSPKARRLREMLADLYAALEEGRPWSLVRLGDGELKILDAVHTPWAHCENRVASAPDMAELRERSVQAIRNADWVGWHQDPWLSFWMDKLGLLPALYQRSVFGWANLHMGIRRGFVERVLRGQRLFLVGEPMERWVGEYLQPLGLAEGAEVYAGDPRPQTAAHLDCICHAVEASSAHVVLVSLGVWALPVCEFAKSVGNVGIDWGHAPDHNLRFHEPDWQYRLNTCCPDTPEGTMAHYEHAGTASQCLPE